MYIMNVPNIWHSAGISSLKLKIAKLLGQNISIGRVRPLQHVVAEVLGVFIGRLLALSFQYCTFCLRIIQSRDYSNQVNKYETVSIRC